MKLFRSAFAIFLVFALMLGSTSCLVFYPRTDNGGHKGWHKNRNNPHHPNTTNPGHTDNPGKSKGKGKGKK